MLELLQHHNAGAFAHDEPVPVAVVGPARPLGSSLKFVESALQAANPAIPSSQIAASAPPATITSASPCWISRDPSPIACAPVEHAVTTEWFGPLNP